MAKRYIDADKAIEAIEKTYGNISYMDDGFTRWDAKEIIRQQPTADVVSKEQYDMLFEHANILAKEMRKYQNANVPERNVAKWTLISERLPEESGKYLVCGGDKIWICDFMCLGITCGWVNDARNPRVEAWMSLPKPYREEIEDDND